MLLPKICMVNSNLPQLKRNSVGHNIYTTLSSGKISCNVRDQFVQAEPVQVSERQANEIFLRMLSSAASDLHCITYATDVNYAIHRVATEMCDWDCVPKNVLVSKKIKAFQEKTTDVVVSGGRSVLFPAKLTMKVIRCSIPLNNEERNGKIFNEPVLYLLADPYVLGEYEYKNGFLKMVMRPVGIFKMIAVS